MATRALLATESQLERSTKDGPITPSSLLNELIVRGVRITAQRWLLVGIRDSSRRLDAAKLLEISKKEDLTSTVPGTIPLLKGRGLIDELDLMHIEGDKRYYETKTSRDHCQMACFQFGAIVEYASSMFERVKEEMANRAVFRSSSSALKSADSATLLSYVPETHARQ
jgi:Fe2+ or Zn2+ uptake regulation protein